MTTALEDTRRFVRSFGPVTLTSSAASGRLATATGEPAPALGCVDPGWVALVGMDELDCAEPVEWPIDEEDLEREVGLDVGL